MKTFLLRFFTWWNGQTLNTQIWTWLYGELVGEDEFGNRYYRTKGGKIDPVLGFERPRRKRLDARQCGIEWRAFRRRLAPWQLDRENTGFLDRGRHDYRRQPDRKRGAASPGSAIGSRAAAGGARDIGEFRP